ncbi:DNA polymerase III subunit beta [Salinivibrio kushneri]|uniref:DNA polymerase III subunit beta n=1 Tax=Salinivibrio kushneri TaxID=1908198 RepID=UPI0009886900|nr:DNA polymerase III subunit beta [Salinivibrio kushneri]OOE42036.1 DNA polymerase III subunit beta [Salinivibrio kushneri]
MKFTLTREQLLQPLQQVSGALGGRSTLPILSNLLIEVAEQQLKLTATDMEVELNATAPLDSEHLDGAITVPSRKFMDIIKGLHSEARITVAQEGDRVVVCAGRSRFTLSTLPASDYPNIEDWHAEVSLQVPQSKLGHLIDATQFSMANQDVRYYLNGLLFETDGHTLRTVGTDGHRMAVCHLSMEEGLPAQQVIVPRKGVSELARLLDDSEHPVNIQIGASNIRAVVGNVTFTSKLVDGRFPDYRRVLPQSTSRTLEVNCAELKQALSLAAVLSNEKFRGVRMNIEDSELRISANNPEQEEAEEFLEVDYQGEPIEIGFNVSYVLDVLNVLRCDKVRFSMTDAVGSTLIEDCDREDAMYVVMPIRL